MKVIMLLVLLAVSFHSTASLLVSPSRLAFDSRDRTQEVILVNTTKDVRSYKLEWVNQRQTPNNSYSLLKESEYTTFGTADKYLRFSPRRVTLQPGESQKIKVMARRRGNMALPEYRSHLKFTALPLGLTDGSENDKAPTGISMKLHLLLSYTIPVVLRTEAAKGDVKLATSSFLEINGKQVVKVELAKNGNTSVYGNFTVYHQYNGEEKAVAFLNGVNFFHEQQNMSLEIPMHHRLEQVTGKLKIVYKGTAEFADTIFDENSIVL